MPTPKFTAEILNAAIEGFEVQKRRIDTQIAEIRLMLDGGPKATAPEPAAVPGPPKRKRRKMSAAGRKAIAEAQRKRWATSKGQSARPPAAATAKPKRRLSAAGKAAIVAALKKRWAAKKAAAKKSQTRSAKAKPTVAPGTPAQ